MKKILAFGASTSNKSINQQFATWAVGELQGNYEIRIIDLNDYDMPVFSVDRADDPGIPQEAHNFKDDIRWADGLLISFAEHNASYSAAFKNLMDWTSWIEDDLWMHKPICILATSPGARGGMNVLSAASQRIPYMAGKIRGQFSLPRFKENFKTGEGITDESLTKQFKAQIAVFEEALSEIHAE